MPNKRYRATLASHFSRLARISRIDVFGDADPNYRPINLPEDSATMFAGYVGRNYTPGKGLLFLAINPGGGGDAYTARIPEDEVFYPLLHKFKAADKARILEAFETVNSAFVPIVKGWNLWRILGPTLDACNADIDEAAYMNAVPYRTRENKMPPVAARRSAWSKIVHPTLEILDPRAIIALGKKAGSVVDALLESKLTTYCVPRTIGDTYLSEGALEIHTKMRTDLGTSNGRVAD